MRLLIVCNTNSCHAQRWVRCFLKRGHEVEIITDSAKKIENCKTYMLPKGRGVLGYLRKIKFVKELVNKIQPEVLEGCYIFGYGDFCARTNFQPLVVNVLGSDILIDNWVKNKFLKIYMKHAIKKVLSRAALIHTVAPHLTQEVTKYCQGKTIFTFPYTPDPSKFNVSVEPLYKEENIVLSVRSLKPIYNVELLIRAIPHVLKKIDGKFIICGQGPEKKKLESLAKKLNVNNKVTFLGHIPGNKMPGVMRSAKIYISTSISDGASVSLLEALACGLFPVVTDIVANRYWIKESENGFLVPTNKPEILANKIIEGIENDMLRNTAIEKNLALIKKYSWENDMEKFEKAMLGIVR